MLTTCPACHTTFRVTEAQLSAHGGLVRCGRCQRVFDARDSLAAEPGLPPEETSPPVPLELPAMPEVPEPTAPPPAPEEEIPAVPEEAIAAPPEEAPAEPSPAVELPEVPAPTVVFEEAPVEPEAVPPPPEAPAEPIPAPLPEEVEAEARPRRWGWLWLASSLLLLATLVLQGAYFYRVDLAARYPELRPALERLCGIAGCTISLPRNPDLWSIEASTLEADPARASLVTLHAVLRNRAGFPQDYPAVELTLTDTRDEMVARRVFPPGEYLPKNTELARGMAAGGEVTVKLHLDLGELKAAGYRLYLFYP